MKNVLFIMHFPPPVHGSSIVGQAIKDSLLINNAFRCRYINLLMSRSVNETGKTTSLKVFRFAGIWLRVLGEILKKRPDICYLALSTTGSAFYKDVMLVALLRAFGIRRVYHLHNKGVSIRQKNRMNRFFYRFVFNKANIILLSPKLYTDVEAFVPGKLTYACPNGIVDVTRSIKVPAKKDARPVRLLFLSNLILSKGVFILLEACSILQRQGIGFECNFVGAEGDLSEAEFHRKIDEMQLSAHVNYLGKKFGDEKHAVLSEADIFVHPTSNDCFPLVLLEAMQFSLPVVSTFEGGIPDIVEDGATGFLVQPNDAATLAARLGELIDNAPLRQEMGKAGRLKYEKEFTLDIFEHRLYEILPKIMEQV